MDFFERQDIARRKTGRLVVLFVIAVIMILLAINAATYGILRIGEPQLRAYRDAEPVLRGDRQYPGKLSPENRLWLRPQPYIAVSLVSLGIIVVGSLYKTAMLSGGGPAVAQLMGGRPLNAHGERSEEKVLQNVVDEMSIASGVPVPQVFVMDDEEGINAFAAGFTQQDAAIGVTRGAITKLNRDELQGVIAHEFSHILNGDMRLNVRLIGILHGILVIALMGYALLRGLMYARVSSSRSDKNGGGAAIILLVALAGGALVLIGYVGLFFGRVIQAAVSRQREFLADASAVQFTRNPSGLAGALKKLGGYSAGSRVQNPNSIEIAHMFFAHGGGLSFAKLLATHPPLEERIRAIDATWRGDFERPLSDRGREGPTLVERYGGSAPAAAGASSLAGAVAAHEVVERAGSIPVESIERAGAMLASIPPNVERAAHEPFGARTVALALLLSEDPSVRESQLGALRQTVDVGTIQEAMQLLITVSRMDRAAQIALMDLIQPALRQMSGPQLRQFAQAAQALIQADGRVTLFEYAMFRMLRSYLEGAEQGRPRAIKYFSLSPLLDDVVTVLSALAYRGKDPIEGAEAFRAGFSRLDAGEGVLASNDYGLKAVDAALNKLADASPGVKRRIVDAAAHAVAHDGIVQEEEAELLRAMCAALGVPLPLMERAT